MLHVSGMGAVADTPSNVKRESSLSSESGAAATSLTMVLFCVLHLYTCHILEKGIGRVLWLPLVNLRLHWYIYMISLRHLEATYDNRYPDEFKIVI